MWLRILILVIASLVCGTVQAQDLAQLPGRVSGFWKLRLDANKADALSFVEPGSRNFFLQQNETGILNFRISAIEIADDQIHADVVLKTRVEVPKYGEFDRTVRESWVWIDSNWYWKAETAATGNPFAVRNSEAASAVREFQITDSVINLGRHLQGDSIEGRIAFRATPNDVKLILLDDQIQGLSMQSPIWTSGTEGYVPFTLNTASIWQNTRKEASLVAIFIDERRQRSSVPITIQIEGRVAFKQTPEIIDPAGAQKIELEIGNLLKAPLKLASAMSSNPAFVVEEPIPESIAAGSSGRVVISRSAQSVVSEGSIELTFSEPVIGSSSVVTVPLRFKLPPPPQQPSLPFSREDAERLLQSVPRNPK